MIRLKADLHTHSGDDPYDKIPYSSEMLIDAAAQLKYDVLAITLHQDFLFFERVVKYAHRRGIILLPGFEATIDGKHVLILNPHPGQERVSTFQELEQLERGNSFIVAPHPFYPDSTCLGRDLEPHIGLFNAIEYCCFYFPGANFNRRAAKIAKQYGLPLIGTTDAHTLPMNDSTVTWIEAEEKTIQGVLDALHKGHFSIETHFRPWNHVLEMCWLFFREKWRIFLNRIR